MFPDNSEEKRSGPFLHADAPCCTFTYMMYAAPVDTDSGFTTVLSRNSVECALFQELHFRNGDHWQCCTLGHLHRQCDQKQTRSEPSEWSHNSIRGVLLRAQQSSDSSVRLCQRSRRPQMRCPAPSGGRHMLFTWADGNPNEDARAHERGDQTLGEVEAWWAHKSICTLAKLCHRGRRT